MPAILFVCTGNLCRSPMAMALLRKRLSSDPLFKQWRVESAGTWTDNGLHVPEKVQVVIEERRADLSAHRSRLLNHALLQEFDLIYVMTGDQQEALHAEFPDVSRRILLFSELAGERYDIADPIAGTIDDVRHVAREIDRLLARGLDRIIMTAAGKVPFSPNDHLTAKTA